MLILLMFNCVPWFQMGKMKEHVRGLIQCCETSVANVMNLTRASELVYNPGFQPINMDIKQRHKEDTLGGLLASRALRSLVIKTDKDVLNPLVRDALEGITGGWEEDDYGHLDLVIEEYTIVAIESSTFFTVDWKHGENATANYFLYYSAPRYGMSVYNRDAGELQPPSLDELESMGSPPLGLQQNISDYYYHPYVGQVNACLRCCLCLCCFILR